MNDTMETAPGMVDPNLVEFIQGEEQGIVPEVLAQQQDGEGQEAPAEASQAF